MKSMFLNNNFHGKLELLERLPNWDAFENNFRLKRFFFVSIWLYIFKNVLDYISLVEPQWKCYKSVQTHVFVTYRTLAGVILVSGDNNVFT